MSKVGDEQLKAFGKAYIGLVDDVLSMKRHLIMTMKNPSHPTDFKWIKYFDLMDPDTKMLKFSQASLESLGHALFSMFEENSDSIQLNIKTPEGDWVNVLDASEEFGSEPLAWMQEYSEYGSVIDDIVMMSFHRENNSDST